MASRLRQKTLYDRGGEASCLMISTPIFNHYVFLPPCHVRQSMLRNRDETGTGRLRRSVRKGVGSNIFIDTRYSHQQSYLNLITKTTCCSHATYHRVLRANITTPWFDLAVHTFSFSLELSPTARHDSRPTWIVIVPQTARRIPRVQNFFNTST